jgi:quinol monooxygenase YgiN
MSGPYKKMRASVGPDKILERPTDLRFLQPTSIGFMTRGGMDVFEIDDHLNEDNRSLVVVQEIRPKQGSKQKLLKDFEVLACHVQNFDKGTACFWVLEYLEEYSDNGIVVFSTFDTDTEYQKHINCQKMEETRFAVCLLLRGTILT